jgi:hypothetical protein
VKGITAIEETVLIGNYNTDPDFRVDDRVQIISKKKYDDKTVLILAVRDAIIKGLSGDDLSKPMIWVATAAKQFTAWSLMDYQISNGLITITISSAVNVDDNAFFLVAAMLPAFNPNSTLKLSETYVPYQGEAVADRNYSVLHTEQDALVTTNGTGSAPVPGLRDIYPFRRELPIITQLPSLSSWSDAALSNQAVSGFFDSNYEAKQYSNVEHTFTVPLHTNDFIEPLSGAKPMVLRPTLKTESGRGFSQVVPHMGFAIRAPQPRTVLGDNLLATVASITLYVNVATGDDSKDGLTKSTAKKTIGAALRLLPPVLRHQVSVILLETGGNLVLETMKSSLMAIPLGDGEVRSLKYYALGNLSFSNQEAGRLVISKDPEAKDRIVIDGSNFSGFGDGPTSAFFIENSKVLLAGIEFRGFMDPAVKGIDANIEFVDCKFDNNLQAGSFEQGTQVTMHDGEIALNDAGTGMVLADSMLISSGVDLTVTGSAPGVFYVAERSSNLFLQNHSNVMDAAGVFHESNVSASNVVVTAKMNSSVTCTGDFATAGKASLSMASVLSRTMKNPFIGGVETDSSSSVTTNL